MLEKWIACVLQRRKDGGVVGGKTVEWIRAKRAQLSRSSEFGPQNGRLEALFGLGSKISE